MSQLGRPLLYTSYASEMSLMNTWSKRIALGVFLVVAVAATWVFEDDLLHQLTAASIAAIGALGLGLVTGYAGQVSLGHAFFLGVGAFTAAAISGTPTFRVTIGYEIPNLLVWLPAAGLVAGTAGVLVAPLATRLRGHYLAVVTLGLVFVGGHVFNSWVALTGGEGLGRSAARPVLLGKDLTQPGLLFGKVFTKDQQLYLLTLVLLVVFALVARNIARSRVGRAFTAIRDRDIAAGVMGVDLAWYKTVAFAISSFYAGCAGALLFAADGYLQPGAFSGEAGLFLSVNYIAMVLIGGAGTISGAILGAFFITVLLPRLTSTWLPAFLHWVELDLISDQSSVTPNIFQLKNLLFGVLIVVFLIFEPRGLFGIWLRVRNYWKTWPFSY